MNRLLLISCALLGLLIHSTFAAFAPEEVADVRWGANLATVQQTVSKRPGVTFDAKMADALTFKGGEFAGDPVETWRFEFTEGKFTKVNIRFVQRPGRNEKGQLYIDLIFDVPHELLRKKYGPPKESSDGDHRDSTWTFPSPSMPGASKKIVLLYRWFGPDRRIDVTYFDIPVPKPGPATPKPRVKDDF